MTYEPFFDMLPALPRGPHGLSRDEVAASQRMRLMGAVAAAVAELGYGGTTIAAITERAAVSPRTFYEHYEDKVSCYLAAYERFATELSMRVARAFDTDAGWQVAAVHAFDAYLGSLEDNADVARAFLIEIEAAGAEARARRREGYRQFAAVIREAHRHIQGDDKLLPESFYLGLVHGVRGFVCDRLDAPGRPQLRDLAPDLLRWMAAVFYGAARAVESEPTG